MPDEPEYPVGFLTTEQLVEFFSRARACAMPGRVVNLECGNVLFLKDGLLKSPKHGGVDWEKSRKWNR